MHTRETRTPGFTRLEALLAMCLCALLFLLSVPVHGTARAKSTRIDCLDQLRELGMAFRRYAEDHRYRYPMLIVTNEGGTAEYLGSSWTSGPESCWRHFWVVSNYLASPKVLVCPADVGRTVARDFEDLAKNGAARNAALSYGLGLLADVSRPGMVLLGDRSMESSILKLTFDGPALRVNFGTNSINLAALAWSSGALHRGAGNVALADGSVRTWSSPALRRGFAESGDSANNHCQPGRLADQ